MSLRTSLPGTRRASAGGDGSARVGVSKLAAAVAHERLRMPTGPKNGEAVVAGAAVRPQVLPGRPDRVPVGSLVDRGPPR